MIKIKICYERPEEIQKILILLGENVKSYKNPIKQKRKIKTAYIELKK